MEHARRVFESVAEQYETYKDIEEHIKSLHSANELTDEEYNYIQEEWDNMLMEFRLY